MNKPTVVSGNIHAQETTCEYGERYFIWASTSCMAPSFEHHEIEPEDLRVLADRIERRRKGIES